MTRGLTETEEVLADTRAELRIATRRLTSSLTAHQRIGLEMLRTIVARLDRVLEGTQR